jgi:hypothetical protein
LELQAEHKASATAKGQAGQLRPEADDFSNSAEKSRLPGGLKLVAAKEEATEQTSETCSTFSHLDFV